MLWGPGERIPVSISVAHAGPYALAGATVSVQVLDCQFHQIWSKDHSMKVPTGPSAAATDMGEFTIPQSLEDKFFFIVAEARDAKGGLISRSVYWPRCLKLMSDPGFRAKYRDTPQPSVKFDHGPWLRPQVEGSPTKLEMKDICRTDLSPTESTIQVKVRNAGLMPAFDTHINIAGTARAFFGTDNDFWLAPGEERSIDLRVQWRDSATRAKASITAEAWNAQQVEASLPAR